jgi:hypothetical protein
VIASSVPACTHTTTTPGEECTECGFEIPGDTDPGSDPDPVEKSLQEIIEDILDLLDEEFKFEDDVAVAVAAIIAIETSDLAEAMKDAEIAELIAALEDAHMLHNDITVTVAVDHDDLGFTLEDVSIVGAGLNVGSGKIELIFSPPKSGIEVGAGYAIAIRFHMTLDSEEKIDLTNLDVPVMITIPIPEGMDPDKFRILHFYAGALSPDEFDIIVPILNEDKTTATFILTRFSEFAFVELADEPDPKPDPDPKPGLDASWKQPLATNKFTDVSNTGWQNVAVSWAELNNITTGSPAGSVFFKPDDVTTRAEFVTFLHRVYGTPDAEDADFDDMPANKDFYNAISWAYEVGITTGTSSNTFSPNDNITREQIAVMLYRYIGGGVPAPDSLKEYTDTDKISTWTDAKEAVNWVVYYGIMGQNTNNILNPGGSATRAEAITMIYRAVVAFGIAAP